MNEIKNEMLKFDLQPINDLTPLNSTLSKGRVRIFYKGLNRNRTYISEDFANQLIKSLPYTPVKGIFDQDELDYDDHGERNTDGRVYGVVMAEPNFAWEENVDPDGTTRLYACADVVYFTGLYSESRLINGKSQSMELNPKTLKGEWRNDSEDNLPYYYFYAGELLGLQILGEMVEPCFEGSSFFTKQDYEIFTKYLKNLIKKEDEKMNMFELVNNEDAKNLNSLINPNYNEENNWQYEYIMISVNDAYCLCKNKENDDFVRIGYSKNENNEFSIADEKVKVNVVDFTEEEFNAIKEIEKIDSFANVVNKYNELIAENESLKSKNFELEKELAEKEAVAATPIEDNGAEEVSEVSEVFETPISNTEVAETPVVETSEDFAAKENELNEKIISLETENAEYQKQISDLNSAKEELMEFKMQIEKSQKEEILSKYEEFIDVDVINTLTETMNNYSVTDFKKEVCTAAVEKNGTSLFSKNNGEQKFYKVNSVDTSENISEIEKIINKHKNGGNN